MKKVLSVLNSAKFYCLLAAIVTITICSKSSFLYPLNDWGDTNCYFIIGKGILKGLVPYRDLYDQKGLIIFLIYSIANLISSSSYFGVYIIEIIAAFLFLYISLKTVSLFIESDRYSFVLAFILAVSVYSSASFCHGGSAEELLLPAFAYGIYIICQQIVYKSVPTNMQMLIFGLCAGIIFFSKYTLCAMYIPIIIVMIIDAYINKSFALLMKRTLFFILGCLIITIPIILYFALNGALYDFYNGYFYNNIFHYAPEEPTNQFSNAFAEFLFHIQVFFRKRNILPILLIGLSFIWLSFKKHYMLLTCHILSFVLLFYIEFFVASPIKYYGIPLYSLCAVGLCIIAKLLGKIQIYKPAIVNTAVILISIVISYAFTDNRYLMFTDITETPQYILAEDIRSCDSDDINLLVYDTLDEGFYQACDTMPMDRAFIQTNLTSSFLKDEQNELINEQMADYIITKKYLCDTSDYEKAYEENKDYIDKYRYGNKTYIVCFDDFGYELVDQTDAYFETSYNIYKLYKKKG